MSNLKQDFGRQLRAARKEHGWTQNALATKAGLSLEMIGMLERGQAAPSLATIENLGNILGVPCAALLGGAVVDRVPVTGRDWAVQRICRLVRAASDTELESIERVVAALLNVPPNGSDP